jgi:hypothetical protein
MKKTQYFYESALIIDDIITNDMVSILKNYAYKYARPLEDILHDYNDIDKEDASSEKIRYGFFDMTENIYKNQTRAEVKHIIQDKIIKTTLELIGDRFPSLAPDQIGLAASRGPLPYHADSEIPKYESDQFLGIPSEKSPNLGFIKPVNNEWIPSINPHRAYSTVIYLEDEFEGGETIFPIKNLEVKPKIGKMLGFPSSRDYIHGAKDVVGASRLTLNIWYRFDISISNNYNPIKSTKYIRN